MRAPRQARRVLSASVKHCWNTCEGKRVNPPPEAHTSFRSVLYTRARNAWRNGTPSVTHTKVKSSEHALQSVLEMQVKRNQNIHWKKKKRIQNVAQMCVRKPRAWDEKLLLLLDVFLETCKDWHPSPLSTPSACPSKEHGCVNTYATLRVLPVWHISHCCQPRLPISLRETTATSPLTRRKSSDECQYDEAMMMLANTHFGQGTFSHRQERLYVTAPKRSGWLMHNLKGTRWGRKGMRLPWRNATVRPPAFAEVGERGGRCCKPSSHIMGSHGLPLWQAWQLSSAESHEGDKVSWMERFVISPTRARSYNGNPYRFLRKKRRCNWRKINPDLGIESRTNTFPAHFLYHLN